MSKIDDFFNAYLDSALWASTDDEDRPMDENYCTDDFDPKSLALLRGEAIDFLKSDQEDGIAEFLDSLDDYWLRQAAHDFWLTRNMHGAGFWDGAWDREFGQMIDEIGSKLTKRAKSYGSMDLCIGDDGRIYA